MTQNTCKQKLSCVFDHFAAVKTMLMHHVFQEITIVVPLILSSYLLMFTSPNLCIFHLLQIPPAVVPHSLSMFWAFLYGTK